MAEEYKSDGPEFSDFRAVAGMDPAANWLLTVGLDDYLADRATTLVPLLLELDSDEAVASFQALLDDRDRKGAVPLGFGGGNDLVRKGVLLPVVATHAWLMQLLDGSERSQRFRDAEKRIVLSSPMEPQEVPALTELPARVLLGPVKGGKALSEVVVGAIDDGFAFVHERFRTAGGAARIEAVWDMNGDFPIPDAPLAEFTTADIDKLVDEATVAGIVDEELVYRRAGLPDAGLLNYADPRHKPMAWRASHGTHVLDLAAGSDPGAGGHAIIAAQLPSPVVARTTGELLDFYVWLGVLYILHRAGERPAVINISFGYDAGPHDGGGLLEKWMSRTVAKRPRTAIVLPAGNAQLSRCHATIDLAANDAVELAWIVQPDDRTHSIVEVWLPEGEPGDRMQVTVVQPDGTENVLPEDPALPPVVMAHAGRPMGLLELWQRPDERRMFRIAIAPTARPQPDGRPLAPAGAWRLRFTPGGQPMTEPANAWVQRDDSLYGYPQRGRQSYFDHEAYRRFDAFGYPMDDDPDPLDPPCPVTRTSLLNAISTSEHLVVAGGYRERDCRIARYSSGGPNTPPEEPETRLKPDVLLPSDGSVAHPGMLAAGARSGARVSMDGTSVAAPELTRYIARWLAAGNNTDRPALQSEAMASPFTCDIPTAEQRGGHGRLERLDALTVARFETD